MLRATWPEDTITARRLLDLQRTSGSHFSLEDLDRIEALKRADRPPADKWAPR